MKTKKFRTLANLVNFYNQCATHTRARAREMPNNIKKICNNKLNNRYV